MTKSCKVDVLPSTPVQSLPQICMMQQTESSYQAQYPALREFPPMSEYMRDKYKYMPQVPNPTDVDATGQQKKSSLAEAVLNWQTQNAVAQNSVLQRIETKVDTISGHFDQNTITLQNIILDIQTRLITLDQQIR